MKTYVTFGYDHKHEINGKVFDHQCVAVIEADSPEEGRDKAFELFGDKFCFEYPERYWTDEKLKYFPRGLIKV